jgi:hypothetical protein
MSWSERTSHFNSLSDGQQFHQYQQKSPLTSTHSVMVNNSTNIKNNHPSPQLIEWWSTIPPILTNITSQVIFVDIGGIVDHQSMSWGEMWFLLILVDLLTIIQWVDVRGDFCWYWWNSTNINKITSHFNSLSDGQQFHQYQQKSPLTFQWVEVRCDFGWYWWNCWPSLNDFRWEVIFVDIGGIVDHHSMSWCERWFFLILVEFLTINKNHLSPQLIEWWSTIPPISTKITSSFNSLSDGQQFHQYKKKSPLTSTHWMMVNNVE